MQVNTMCVIGAGTMGTGIAQVAAQAGIHVHLLDTSEEAVSRSQGQLEDSLHTGIERGKITAEEAEDIRRLITWGMSYASLAEADWVIEAVFEDLQVKQEVLSQVAAHVGQRIPVASNTSSLLIRDLAEFFGRPEIGMHFSNPAPAMKLVEVVPGEKTLPTVTEAAVALCERMSKIPIIAPDIPGFVLNRLFGALVAAALEIWARGVEPEVIDSTIELGLGHKMGPLRTADLVGLDVMIALLRSLYEQTGHTSWLKMGNWAERVARGFTNTRNKLA